MKAFVVEGPGRFRLEERLRPAPGPGEVLVRVEAAGICGSDLEMISGIRDPGYYRYPVVPGREWPVK
ncbi:hypothetical protein E0L93_02705 [Rubrobacter taiwanensis]|uniref:Alcohol dehydrogenase-like N-terminal domain-containing protein n=1 Tax=Rubrobacter taiwanensis TaxID=185139 RepID=A0A4R1BQ72_9ACTN|nr:alcohol dehydrogenase catalytic domain-containing protein [Rubrobacter taiwanensis]TCJ19883.1 hypothetical protein E0L93_02705 [Rubrobacter taiwanensis]